VKKLWGAGGCADSQEMRGSKKKSKTLHLGSFLPEEQENGTFWEESVGEKKRRTKKGGHEEGNVPFTVRRGTL